MKSIIVYKYIHTAVLVLVICFFLQLYLGGVYEPFYLNNDEIKANNNELKARLTKMMNTPIVNDPNYGVVSLTSVPYSSAKKAVEIGLLTGGLRQEIGYPIGVRLKKIVGINVPEGLRITIYEKPDFQGHFNAIVGPNVIDDMTLGSALEYPEEEDENGVMVGNNFGGVGWQNRVKSFIVHRWKEIPDSFNSVFYAQKYGINDYEDFKALGENTQYLAQQTKDAQWQHFLDFGESLGYVGSKDYGKKSDPSDY